MSKWKQISGDMTWEKHGLLLAKVDASRRQVELLRIEPWGNHDHEAQLSHGLYLVDEGTFDYEDFDVKKNEDAITSAIASAGMDLKEFKKLPVEGKAEVLSSYQGFEGDGRSTNSLIDALPDKPENIEFWGGPETAEKVEEYARQERRDAVDHHFGSSLDVGELPSDEALEFAWEKDGISIELGESDEEAIGYAKAFDKVPVGSGGKDISIKTLASFKEIVAGLGRAPDGDKIEANSELVPKFEKFLGRKFNQEDIKDWSVANDMAEQAHKLGSFLMEAIGFSW